MLKVSGNQFVDSHNRVLMLRGVNLGGSSKVPVVPDGSTYRSEGFFNHREVSFVGRPFPLTEADEHYRRLRSWGFNTLRFLVTWEAIEHAGPGIYDQSYLDYLHQVVSKAGEWGFMVFIDPHQDVWSRFSGGDGAPGWTLEAAGLDMTKFKDTGAAIVHQTHGDPFPRMVWPTNASKLAAATMFTLFFAGNDFAPNTRVDSIPIQDYLQRQYLSAMRQVAEKLKDLDCVIGYDIFNEPQRGFVGVGDLALPYESLQLGPSPTPWQSILLGSGFTRQVAIYRAGRFGIRRRGSVTINPSCVSTWLPGRVCVWRENGVWDLDPSGQPVLLRPDHFSSVNGRRASFSQDYLLPFTQSYAQMIHAVSPEALIFFENEVEDASPLWKDAEQHRMVYAAHWYDGAVLFQKQFAPWLAVDVRTRRPVFGRKAVQRSIFAQIAAIKSDASEKLGGVPLLIGEFGIPFDLNDKKAFTSGDFSIQVQAMDRSMRPMESHMLNYTLWNYTSDNINARGDRWNDEDLSIFSRDQQADPADLNSGGRALPAVIRPFPTATGGQPVSLSFDIRSRVFRYVFRSLQATKQPTEIFVPTYHYPEGINVILSDGAYQYDPQAQLLTYSPGDLDTHTIEIHRA